MMWALLCAGLLGLAMPVGAATGPDASAECVSCHDDEEVALTPAQGRPCQQLA